MNTDDVAKISKALSEPKRLEIIKQLSIDEKCANDILKEFNITQPTLSHHMKQLTGCNLVNKKKEGKTCNYSINKDTLIDYIEFFEEIKR